ncbi:DsbE family thiol:disulfide interchange protein [Stappia sp. F7233]|uniref:DsbE family thiol:disulfide interchange protein n=1 Tax=Stappia albiluteola TaxID=2758565 RepID=A0A839A8M8_9HYPH|nr:DsbE family thiol:disulfide interchange protein [Stappia albiluteola]MBA5775576.1 DsbE family thiol:disulfide interchange protein [Stappia albiluteola]
MRADISRSPTKLSWFALAPLVFFALIGGLLYWGLFNRTDRLPSPLIGKPAPQFHLPPIEGRTDGLSTADLIGQVSIVNVWASWCVPCRVEMPLLNELAESNEVTIFGINYKDNAKEALAFLEELGDPYTKVGADRTGRVAIEWGVYGLPETFVIDAEGRIAYKHIGPFNRHSLEADILPLVQRLQAGGGT